MQCTTIRSGQNCPFMTKAGCSFNGGVCMPILEACEGCGRIIVIDEVQYCSVSPNPLAKWKVGNCNMATHVKVETKVAATKLNPIKASKRMAGKK